MTGASAASAEHTLARSREALAVALRRRAGKT
jgi:hypothetical protein